MNVAALQLTQAFKSSAGVVISGSRDGQRDQNLVGVQTRVRGTQVLSLQSLDRRDCVRRQQLHLRIDTRQDLQGVQQHGR